MPLNEDDAFIETILQNPDDDAPRLVYADWLEERGDPRSELIRARCGIANLPEGDRLNLEQHFARLWADHRDEWLEYCGLVLIWDQILTVFKRCLAETITWCGGRNPDSLRTPALQPSSLLRRFVVPQGQQVWSRPTTDQWQRSVNTLANRRKSLLSEGRKAQHEQHLKLAGGRLVLFYPDATLSDAAAEAESQGYFDADNVPVWDTWVFYPEVGNSQESIYDSYLVAWVPPHLIDAVHWGIQVNPEECIRWAADVDTPFTRKLREAGLLG